MDLGTDWSMLLAAPSVWLRLRSLVCERERFPSVVWERERLPSEVTLEPEAVRERARRVMLADGTERRGFKVKMIPMLLNTSRFKLYISVEFWSFPDIDVHIIII